MTRLLFRIHCLTSLVHVGYAISSRQKLELIKARTTKREYNEHSPIKRLVFFAHNLPSESSEESNPEESSPDDSLTNQNPSGEILKGFENNVLRNQSQYLKRKPTTTIPPLKTRHTSKERLQISKEQQAQKEHERKVKEIIKHVSVHYQSNIYLTYEARRIKHTGRVMDELRQLAEDLVKPKYKGLLKNKAVECGKAIYVAPPFVWPRPNTVLIHVLKDALNDGVYNK